MPFLCWKPRENSGTIDTERQAIEREHGREGEIEGGEKKSLNQREGVWEGSYVLSVKKKWGRGVY